MAEHVAGWYADPYQRFEQRFFDGVRWTEHVVSLGAQQIDPKGAGPELPAATPATTAATPTVAGPVVMSDPGDITAQADPGAETEPRGLALLDLIGPDAKLRPRPSLRLALAGLGGFFLAAAIALLIVGEHATKSKAVTASLVVIGVGYALRLLVRDQAELRSAAVPMGAFGIIGFVAAVNNDDPATTGPLFLVAALLLAAWVLPGFRGRPLLLSLGATFVVFALNAALQPDPRCYDYGYGEVCERSSSGITLPGPFRDVLGDQSVLFLGAAAVLLGLVWWLDRRGYHGTATALVAPGLLSAFVGTGESFTNLGDAGPAILIAIVGVLVCVVGNHGGRRATTWWGAVLAAVGTVGFWIAVMEPKTTSEGATSLLVASACLIVGPLVIRAIQAKNAASSPPPFAPPPVGQG